MDISIIIPTYNNCKILKRTLDNFCTSVDFSEVSVEIVVVNNNSNDETDKVIEQYKQRLPINSVFESKQGISFAKNAGIENASGNLLIFTDDDVKPSHNWILSYWNAFCKNPLKYFWGGSVISDFESAQPSPDLLMFAPPSVSGMNLGEVARQIEDNEYFVGANWACPQEILKEIGGFDEALGLNPQNSNAFVGEETDLMLRLRKCGYVGVYLPDAFILHFVPSSKTTLRHIAERKEAHGYYCYLEKKVPMWVYRSFLENGLKLVVYKLLGFDSTREYVYFKEAKGILKSLIHKLNSEKR